MLVQQCTNITALSSLAASPLLRVIRVILILALAATHESNEMAQIKNLIINTTFLLLHSDYDKRALLLRREIQSLNKSIVRGEDRLARARDRNRGAEREGHGTQRLDAITTGIEVMRARLTVFDAGRRCAVHRNSRLLKVCDRLDRRAGVLYTTWQARVRRERRRRLRETDRQGNGNRDNLTSLERLRWLGSLVGRQANSSAVDGSKGGESTNKSLDGELHVERPRQVRRGISLYKCPSNFFAPFQVRTMLVDFA